MVNVTGPDAGICSEAMNRFTAAEGRLYPMALVDPAGYERATTLIGVIAAQLRSTCADIDSVLRARDDLIARLPEFAAAAHVTATGLSADVVDAASALRCRELQAAAARCSSRTAGARASCAEWIVDDAEPGAVMAGSFRRVERHLPTGTTLITSMEAGGAGGVTYTIEVVADECERADVSTYPDRDAWFSAAQRLRADLSTRHGSPDR